MTFRGLQELQEQSRNAAHTSAITHRMERLAGTKWSAAGDGSRQEMDRGRIWIATGYGWMPGDGSQEMDHERQMTIGLCPS